MLNQTEADERRARVAEIEANQVALGEVARWFGPWVLAGVLAAIFVAGLWTASSAADDGAYAVGLAAAALALAVLVWELSAALGGGLSGFSARILVDDAESLVVLIALLVVLALAGIVLAARADSVAASGAGYGLCLFGLVFSFANLKHYFDRRDAREG